MLALIPGTFADCQPQGKGIIVCGEMVGDISMTRLLLGLGLRSFSMRPSQILAVKQQVLWGGHLQTQAVGAPPARKPRARRTAIGLRDDCDAAIKP